MAYWRWLREWIKVTPFRRQIKDGLLSRPMEFVGGIVATGYFTVLGFWFGATGNRLYYLLLLGVIPSILIALHGEYRHQMRRKRY